MVRAKIRILLSEISYLFAIGEIDEEEKNRLTAEVKSALDDDSKLVTPRLVALLNR